MSEQRGFNVDTHILEEEAAVDRRFAVKAEIFDWLRIFSVVIVTVVFLFTFVFKIATIEGRSMQDTLFENQKVIIVKPFYTPKQGDIVVISRNADNAYKDNKNYSALPIIKRVIATEGQTVDIDFARGTVSVDGEVLNESYVRTPTNLKYDIEFPVTVKKGCVFVLGDNRNESLDSRSSEIGDDGMIDTRYILGHAVLRVFPLNKIKWLSGK